MSEGDRGDTGEWSSASVHGRRREERRQSGSSSDLLDRYVGVDVEGTRRTSWAVVALVLVAVAVLNAVINLFVFTSDAMTALVFRPVLATTAGLVRPTLLVNLALLAVVVGSLLRSGIQSPSDLGVVRDRLHRGIVVTVALWLAIQVVGAGVQLATRGTIRVDDAWANSGTGAVMGAFLAQAFGNALFEEVLYRGFLLTQLFLLFDSRISDDRLRLVVALTLSQGIFAAMHVPNRIYQGYAIAAIPGNLALVFVSGLIFALAYYRTGNLFVAVGIHALGNAPLAVLVDGSFAAFLTNPAAVVLITAWTPIERGLSWFERSAGIRTPEA